MAEHDDRPTDETSDPKVDADTAAQAAQDEDDEDVAGHLMGSKWNVEGEAVG